MFRIIFLFVAFWLLYKLVFDLIVPIYRSTKVMRSKFREMHEQMQNEMKEQRSQDNFSTTQKVKPEGSKGDYIEFEEVP
jgi:predicted tellurium resistance membrane protein TerC